MERGAEALQRARLAMAMLAVDPCGLGGLWLRARPGPVHEAVLRDLGHLEVPPQKIHPGLEETTLFGGIDIAGTLAAGKVVRTKGLLARSPALLLTSAERCPARFAAHLAGALDVGQSAVIALDEGTDEESAPPALTERLGLFLTLEDIPVGALSAELATFDLQAARGRLGELTVTTEQIEALTLTALRLGIGSLRAPLFAIAAARAHAALMQNPCVEPSDLKAAAELVYAHRACIPPEETTESPETETAKSGGTERDGDDRQIPDEMLVEAAQAAIAPDLLAKLSMGKAARGARSSAGAGARKRGLRRGRPLPARSGRIDGGARVDVVATLRAAAPWQPIRRRTTTQSSGVLIRREDIRIRRYEEHSDRLLIFTVDASGSTAMARLAEAKGAVEILLSEAYARRDYVALVAFRGEEAETLLPPTRSLVQTKRRLQALPGGGGTPLASGLMGAYATAETARARGMTPTIALLTDGKGNIALDGRADRAVAAEDADRAARLIQAGGIPSVVIDTSLRPQAGLKSLADRLDAAYLAMPRADARRMSAVLRDTTDL